MKKLTKVIFRIFPEGDVIALFPAQAGTCHEPGTCSSYMHTGQHGAADLLGVTHSLRLATPAEFRPLASELRRIGYKLNIAKRASQADYQTRKEQLAR